MPVAHTVERPDLETAEGPSTFTWQRGATSAAVPAFAVAWALVNLPAAGDKSPNH